MFTASITTLLASCAGLNFGNHAEIIQFLVGWLGGLATMAPQCAIKRAYCLLILISLTRTVLGQRPGNEPNQYCSDNQM